MAKRASLKDIASKVGASTALVSYVINGKEKEGRVGAEMVKKIRKAARELNYQPNLIARGLKFGKTKTIGLLVADISNPFFATLAKIIEVEAQKNGYTVIFGSSDEELEKMENLINTFLNRQVDGLIIVPVEGSEKQIRSLKRSKIPFVLMDRNFDTINTNSVVLDNYNASYEAVNLLLDRGFSRIAMIAHNFSLSHMKNRVEGYKNALSDRGIIFNPKWTVQVDYKKAAEEVEQALINLTKKGANEAIEAILFATNSISVFGLKTIHKLKIKVPEELAVISFDENDVFTLFYCPITYIKQNLQAIGENSVQMLIDNIEHADLLPRQKIVRSELVVNKSSGKNKFGDK